MKISFPHMGHSYIAFKWLVENIGHECIVPPEPSKRTLDLGVRYAPEFACIPFKILMGTYLEVAEKGAEVIITSGGMGPCRAGYYWVMHQYILNELGKDLEIIAFEPPLCDLKDFWRKLHRLRKSGGLSVREFIQVIKTAWEKIKAIDDIEMRSHEVRPYEINRGDTTRALWKALDMIDKANSVKEIEEARQEGLKVINQVPQDLSRNPLKVGIVGEIYVVLEPAANHYIQIMLGEMGVQTDRSIYLTSYTRESAIINREEDIFAVARPYIKEAPIGGHGVNSIGETILYAKHGFDGVVQLAPFACIPEIVAKSILPKVSRDYDIPVLTLFIDEQTGKAGVQTRLEAFVDLLEKRRESKKRERLVV
ncbi:Predicted nucleotide-binding protein, sugar kinase/HSP70/actin superfamily [Thermosyntropha lipolytica DSM 11003]|uniref:Predicted nucleotide-binding protein, sugar kinase/HSP70/actin superfamily n=1 Tax=Thermosyntropha lipolytica DSM 11003 TaxID=1123382 RepID=A0A1M5QVM1_9FIRM|nr:2-hydroxyacyl-CoA dehydratase [Thermosyntropha lipolytica]SHH18227.1 Predicted nucleotide-binding protein, sugar kinase/HSP70/actin superfamily [Thermosyntropha lipolytica DSM 11003]